MAPRFQIHFRIQIQPHFSPHDLIPRNLHPQHPFSFFFSFAFCFLSVFLAFPVFPFPLALSFPFLLSLAFLFAPFWWLVRVTLVVDWLFLPQNFGPVVGTYEGLLPFCECTWGGGSMFRWWGHLTTIRGNRTFCTHRWWGP